MPGRDLNRRVGALEAAEGVSGFGAAILMEPGETEADALRKHEAIYGQRKGEPLFIYLNPVDPPAWRWPER